MDTINELTVTFYPELYLQRRVWILNFLRKHGIARVNRLLVHFRSIVLMPKHTGPRRRMWRRSSSQHALPTSTMADASAHYCSPGFAYFVSFLMFSVTIYLRGAVIARVYVQG